MACQTCGSEQQEGWPIKSDPDLYLTVFWCRRCGTIEDSSGLLIPELVDKAKLLISTRWRMRDEAEKLVQRCVSKESP